MLLRRLKLSGLLSFGPRGVDLPLAPLNVLIGANGSGSPTFWKPSPCCCNGGRRSPVKG